jgi:catechol 2,3-dioxygenase-like lactoylglutathione lyase family enzyme
MTVKARVACVASLWLVLSVFPTQIDGGPRRPKIIAIVYARLLTSDYCAGVAFYSKFERQPRVCPAGEKRVNGIGFANSHGHIGLHTRTSSDPANSLAEIAFRTDDAASLRHYLVSNGVSVSGDFKSIFRVHDPEGHVISFLQLKPGAKTDMDSSEPRIIHAGFVVRDRAAMDHFYKDILGFHLYWHGGMKDDIDDWVDMQVPDGTDWIEYMLNVPVSADHHTLGVMNHIALGVPDINAAQQQLRKNGWKANEQPQIGRDGKWQLNLYDPDDTRIELMEFTPVEKPCCSEYTGPHPKP